MGSNDINCISAEEVAISVTTNPSYTGAEITKYDIKPASDTILGFIGEHFRIIITAQVGSQEKNLQYFAKKIPTKVQSHREYAEATRAFYKEIELFKTLFIDMQDALSPDRRLLRWRPNCFYTRDWDLLIMEDLSQLGYYMLPPRDYMDLAHVKATIKVMARMHAGSIIFEEKLNSGLCTTRSPHFKPDSGKVTIRDLYTNLIFESECTDKPDHPGYKFWEVGIKSQNALVDLLPGYTEEQKEKIKQTFPDTVRKVYRMLEPSEKYRNVMTHADLWGNNLLFRAEPEGQISAIMVDFQMTRYAPPAQDLFMLLHVAQDRAFRDKHEADLIEFYYNFLAQELTAEGLNVNILLPRQEFEDSCIYYKRYAVLNQIIYTQLTITPTHLCEKFMSTSEEYDRTMYEDRTDILVESYETDDLCRVRTIEAMDEVIQVFSLA